jgi:hypothetical protein
VSPEVPVIGGVGVQGSVCVLVVIPVIRDPLDRIALKAKALSKKQRNMMKSHLQQVVQSEQAGCKGSAAPV